MPADTSGTFEQPAGPPHPGPFALTVSTTPTTPPGTYQPIVTCVAGALSASKTLALTVTDAPDYRVVMEPNSLILNQGQEGVADFQVQGMNAYPQAVNLSASGAPSGVSVTFTPAAVFPTGAGTVRFTVSTTAPPGVYAISIVATANDQTIVRTAPFQVTVLQSNVTGSWRELPLGDTPAKFYGVVVGDVGNTGRSRVFASGGQGVMYEYAFNGTSWSFSRMPVGVSGDAEMHHMAIGPARGDGINRLYIAVSGGDKVYECSWVASVWQCPIMVNLVGAADVIIGDGRNDGRTRMYVTWMSGTTEFTWNGSAWTSLTMSSNETGWVHGIDLGPGRSDGLNRVYTGNQGNGEVCEYSWNGSAWSRLLMGGTGDSRNIEVAEGRNDGRIRVYVPGGDSNLYEFTWTGSTWQKTSMSNAGASGVKVQAIPARARSDNLVRLYGASSDGGVDEYTWTGSAWQTRRLGAATAYMYGLAAGDGINDGTIQIYGASYDGQAYLFQWVPGTPVVAVPTVVNLTQTAATTALQAVGLMVGTVTSAPSATVPLGSVISQSPGAGAQVAPGSPVSLVVSSGAPPPVPVPNVVGQTQSAAAVLIAGAGLTVGSVSSASSTTVPSGSVISETPVAGTSVPPSSAVDLVVSSGPPSAPGITVDKLVFSDGSGTRTTAAFSTSTAGEILVAFVASDGPTSGGQAVTISGAGLTWTLVKRANTQFGTSEIWAATAAAPLTNVTVRSVQAKASFRQSLTVAAFGGSDGIGTSAVASDAPTVSVTTTKPGSLVYAVGNDWDKAIARVLGPGQAMAHQWVDTTTGDTDWVQATAAAVPAANTTVQLNDISPITERWNFAAVEITRK